MRLRQRSPRPHAGFKGAASRRGARGEGRKGKGGERKGKGGEVREGGRRGEERLTLMRSWNRAAIG